MDKTYHSKDPRFNRACERVNALMAEHAPSAGVHRAESDDDIKAVMDWTGVDPATFREDIDAISYGFIYLAAQLGLEPGEYIRSALLQGFLLGVAYEQDKADAKR